MAVKKTDRENCGRHATTARRKEETGVWRLKIVLIVQLGYEVSMTMSRETHREMPPEAGELGGPGAKGALATALALCLRNKISLTPGRRRILEILARAGRRLGDYCMIAKVAQVTGKRP